MLQSLVESDRPGYLEHQGSAGIARRSFLPEPSQELRSHRFEFTRLDFMILKNYEQIFVGASMFHSYAGHFSP